MKSIINFYNKDVKLRLNNKTQLKNWIKSCALSESKIVGEISVIFCSDEHILEINKEHLNHDYYTDIITFNYNSETNISGDLFISIDTVKDNAKALGIVFEKELYRVIIHGVLHLIGYNDKTRTQQKQIRKKEDFYLSKI